MSASHFMNDWYCNVLPPLLPIFAARFSISFGVSAALLMIFALTSNFLQVPIGLKADRKGLNHLLPWAMISVAVSSCAIIFSQNLWQLVLLTALSGLCTSLFHPIGASILKRIYPHRHETLAMSVFIACGNIGFAIAPFLITSYIGVMPENSLILLALPAVVIAVLIWKQRLNYNYPAADDGNAPIRFGALLHSKNFVMLNAAMALRTWSYSALLATLPLMMRDHGASAAAGALSLVIMLLGAAAGGLAAGALSDRLGLKTAIALTFMLTIGSLWYFLTHIGTDFDAMLSLFLIGAGVYGSTPAALVWAQRLLPANAALAASMMLGFTFGLGAIEAVVSGMLGDLIGIVPALMYTLIPAAAAGLIIILCMRAPAAPNN